MNSLEINTMSDPISTKDAAQMLGVNERTILRLIERKILRAKKFGYYWMVEPESIEEYRQNIEGKSKYDPTKYKDD